MSNFFIVVTMFLICFLTLISPLFFDFITPNIALPSALLLTTLFAFVVREIRGY
ncbi:hypothetical protein BTI679_63210 (plasmid) [Bacillus wiedmannii]|nr:hypothetical protein BTI679_63210 [Bacillus wiedmannii]